MFRRTLSLTSVTTQGFLVPTCPTSRHLSMSSLWNDFLRKRIKNSSAFALRSAPIHTSISRDSNNPACAKSMYMSTYTRKFPSRRQRMNKWYKECPVRKPLERIGGGRESKSNFCMSSTLVLHTNTNHGYHVLEKNDKAKMGAGIKAQSTKDNIGNVCTHRNSLVKTTITNDIQRAPHETRYSCRLPYRGGIGRVQSTKDNIGNVCTHRNSHVGNTITNGIESVPYESKYSYKLPCREEQRRTLFRRGTKSADMFRRAILESELHGNCENALTQIEELLGSGLIVDLATYNSALSLCRNMRRWELIPPLFSEIRKAGLKPSESICNDLLFSLIKDGKMQKSHRLYRDLPRLRVRANVIPYDHLISAFEQCGMWKIALRVFDEMSRAGVKRSEWTYRKVLSACGTGGEWQRAVLLLRDMKNAGHMLDTYVYSSAIAACRLQGNWTTARELFQEMEKLRIPRNVITFSSLIAVYDKGGEWKKALNLFREMPKMGVHPNSITYGSVISACGNGGQWEMAVCLLREMISAGVQPTIITYNSVLAACAQAHKWQEAYSILRYMPKVYITPDTVSYNSTVSAFGKGGQWQDLVTLLDEMKFAGFEMDAATYGSVIEALQRHGNMQDKIDIYYDNMARSVDSVMNTWAMLHLEGLLDLHGHSETMAKAAVRRLLGRLQKQQRSSHTSDCSKFKGIIVGRGGVLANTIKKQLSSEMSPPISARVGPNKGVLLLDQSDVESYVRFNKLKTEEIVKRNRLMYG
eukprot:CFRG7689T1